MACTSLDTLLSQVPSLRAQFHQFIDTNNTLEVRLKAAQEFCDAVEGCSSENDFSELVNEVFTCLQRFLNSTQPQYLQENSVQQLRKQCLEIMQKIPNGEHTKPYSRSIISLLFRLIEYENEENVLICVKLIIEMHKYYRPTFSPDVNSFLKFVREVYRELQNQTSKIFEPRTVYHVASISDLCLDTVVLDTFTVTRVTTDEVTDDRQPRVYHILPKSCYSLKVMQEIPILVVLMYQLYKQNIHQDVSDFIPLIMEFINLKPNEAQRQSATFDRNLFTDFLAAQVKTLSFLAYVVKIYLEQVERHVGDLVSGMMNLLVNCPSSVTNMRKEFFIAARHILGTPEIRPKFVDVVADLCDEKVLVGDGFTVRDALRPLAYSTLADLTHHIRTDLNLSKMALAVNLFGRNIHDDTLPVSIQTMSLKLVLNLVECIRARSDRENSPLGRDLLVKILHICVLKCKSLVKRHLPYIEARAIKEPKETEETSKTEKSKSEKLVKEEIKTEAETVTEIPKREEEKVRTIFGPQQQTMTLTDFRSFAKALIQGMKTVVVNLTSCKANAPDGVAKQMTSKDTREFIRFFKYAFRMLDVYLIVQRDNDYYIKIPLTPSKSTEEKQIVDHLASTFSLLSAVTFHEIFSNVIDLFIQGAKKNPYHHVFASNLMVASHTSPIFAHVLLSYLVKRIDKLGDGTDESQLYMKLFKVCFSSVSLLPQDNEIMMQVHLKRIVLGSMECCLTSKDPSVYMTLLRALFRSIGGGSHEKLYREFFPLLPQMLTLLNRLLRWPHRLQVRDLLGELCVIVPVRLSTLLPYLHLLMEPLVHVLNCNTLNQGLRTMELCVDNMNPDFLYDHIYTVRGDMMLALYNSMRSSTDRVSQMAFKVLGKLGGYNRVCIAEAQRLLVDLDAGESGPSVVLKFHESRTYQIEFPVKKVVDTAVEALEDPTTDQYTKERSFNILRGYLVALLQPSEEPRLATALFRDTSFRERPLTVAETSPLMSGLTLPPKQELERQVFVRALTGVFISSLNEPLRKANAGFITFLVRHLTLTAVAEQAGPFTPPPSQSTSQSTLEPSLLVDALMAVMAHENKELVRLSSVLLGVMHSTAQAVLGSAHRVAQLPLFIYLGKKLTELFYSCAWYVKWGACATVQCLVPVMHISWLQDHLLIFMRGLMFVLHDLSSQISQGALDMARDCMRRLLTNTLREEKADPEAVGEENRRKSLANQVCAYLVTCLISENSSIRSEAQELLRLVAELMSCSLSEAVSPHKHSLDDFLPPKLRLLKHHALSQQIAIMDANYFMSHRETGAGLVQYDMEVEHHKKFIVELRGIMDSSDETLQKTPCYAGHPVDGLVPLRVAACRVLSTLWYIELEKDKTFAALFRGICSETDTVHEPAFLCLREYVSHTTVDTDVRHNNVKPILTHMRTWDTLKVTTLKQISYCAQIFPSTFSERLLESLQNHLTHLLEELTKTYKSFISASKLTIPLIPPSMEVCENVIDLFHLIPTATQKYIPNLTRLVLTAEQNMYIEASSPLQLPLLKFLVRYPKDTINMFLTEPDWMADRHANRFFVFALSHSIGGPLREYLRTQRRLLMDLLGHQTSTALAGASAEVPPVPDRPTGLTAEESAIRYLAVQLIHVLHKHDHDWFVTCTDLISALLTHWLSPEFKTKQASLDEVDYNEWNEPKLMTDCFITYTSVNRDEFDLLFHMVSGMSLRSVTSMHHLRDHLARVADKWTPDWKRRMFFRLVELQKQDLQPEQLVEVMQFLIIPCFHTSLERGELEELMGGRPRPHLDSDDDVMNVFVNVLVGETGGATIPIRIMYFQFACLLIEFAPNYIHDVNNKKQGTKIRRILNFAWPSVSSNPHLIDLQEKYYGLMLLAHLISKFNIAKKITIQVLQCLAKGTHTEAKKIVNPSIDILITAWLSRTDDATTLAQATKKILLEDQGTQACLHALHMIIRHADRYYPVREHLVALMINCLVRVSNQTMPADQRRMILDTIETMVRWDVKAKEEAAEGKMTGGGPLDKSQREHLANLMIRYTCQAVEANQNGSVSADAAGRRALQMLEATLQPSMWSDIDLKVNFIERFLSTDPPNNQATIYMTLEIIKTLFNVVDKVVMLTNVKYFSKAFSLCLKVTTNAKLNRFCAGVVGAMLAKFPAEAPSKQKITILPELMEIYNTVSKVITEAFQAYESNAPNPRQLQHMQSLQSAFHLLSVTQQANQNSYAFVDRCIVALVKLIQKLKMSVPQVGGPPAGDQTISALVTENLISGLEIIKSRLNVIPTDMRKSLIAQDILYIVDKAKDGKLMKAVISILKDWISLPKSEEHFAPTIREKGLLYKGLYVALYSRWTENADLRKDFLDAVYLYYIHDGKTPELFRKLELAYTHGMRCPYPEIRQRFIDLFLEGSSIKPGVPLPNRILFLLINNLWEEAHWKEAYWLPSFLEVLLIDVDTSAKLTMSAGCSTLAPPEYVVRFGDAYERQTLNQQAQVKEEPVGDVGGDTAPITPAGSVADSSTEDLEVTAVLMDMASEGMTEGTSSLAANPPVLGESTTALFTRLPDLNRLIARQNRVLMELKQTTSRDFLQGVLCLTYRGTDIAKSVFLEVFPRMWRLLSTEWQGIVIPYIRRFIGTDTHSYQADQNPNPLGGFFEAVIRCENIMPNVADPAVQFIGSFYNQWHRAVLLIEDYFICPPQRLEVTERRGQALAYSAGNEGEPDAGRYQPTYNLTLIVMYEKMLEDDYLQSCWLRRCPENRHLIRGMAYAQQGLFGHAVESVNEFLDQPVDATRDRNRFYNYATRYLKQLNQWDALVTYGVAESNWRIVCDSAWRVPDWRRVQQASQYIMNCNVAPRVEMWRYYLINGYLRLQSQRRVNAEGDFLSGVSTTQAPPLLAPEIEEKITGSIIKEWRRLPRIISDQHIPYLQGCHRAVELTETNTILSYMAPPRQTILNDVRSLAKTWRSRLPLVSDDLSFWNEIIYWRQIAYGEMLRTVNGNTVSTSIPMESRTHLTQLCHHEVVSHQLNLVKACRKQHQPEVAQQYLEKYKTTETQNTLVFERAKQEFKLKMTDFPKKEDSVEGLELVEKTNIMKFKTEDKAKFFCYKALFFSMLNKGDEATKNFGYAIQIDDNIHKVWSMYGDFLENVFLTLSTQPSKRETAVNTTGAFAMLSLMEAAAIAKVNESKARSHVAKCFSLLTLDDANLNLAKCMEDHANKVKAEVFLPWIPNLVTCLLRSEGRIIIKILSALGVEFPAAVYLPVKCLYQQATREAKARRAQDAEGGLGASTGESPTKASDPLWSCNTILKELRELHPSRMNAIDQFCDQLQWLTLTWSEQLLAELTAILQSAYSSAFEQRSSVVEATVPIHLVHDLCRLGDTFGLPQTDGGAVSSADVLAERKREAEGDDYYKVLKSQFANDFANVGGQKLQVIISKLAKRWIPMVTRRVQLLPNVFYLDERTRFLSEINSSSVDLDLPGDMALLKPIKHYLSIANVMPLVRRSIRHGSPSRLLSIRASNGRLFYYSLPAAVVSGGGTGGVTGLYDCWREARPIQLFRLMNDLLAKERETSRRHLAFSTPRIMEAGPGGLRLVEEGSGVSGNWVSQLGDQAVRQMTTVTLAEVFETGGTQCVALRDPYEPLHRYFDRLVEVQARGAQTTHQVMQNIFREVKGSVDSHLLRDWARRTLLEAEDFWHFRHRFTQWLGLLCLSEHILHLTRLNPDMLFMEPVPGQIRAVGFRFDISDTRFDLDANRPVPFRLTPNMQELMGPLGEKGPLSACMLAAARALSLPKHQFYTYVRAVLRDDYVLWHRGRQVAPPALQGPGGHLVLTNEKLGQLLNKATDVVAGRLKNMATFDNAEPRVNKLIATATSVDNLCRMEPSWHPWL